MTTPTPTTMIDALLAVMTPAEKAGQLTQYFYFGSLRDAPTPDGAEQGDLDPGQQADMVEAVLARGGAGSLLFVTDPAETNRLQRLAIDGNRHGIPALFGFDVIHGLRTILPVPIAMAASWDPGTIERGQAMAAREARAVGIHWTFAPMVDIARDPRWGRIVEGAGEDPYLAGVVAAAQVRGFQGPTTGTPERVIAGPKHFAGYGAAAGGRDYDEAHVSDDELWNVYLPPFKAAVDAGAGNVMTAYLDLNGIPATGNRWLFTEVLRDLWGFRGFVVSDAQAVHNLVTHGFAADLTDAGARALNAGVDMEMAIADPAFAHLPEALLNGAVSDETLDTRVRRVLEAKFRLGLFDNPFVDEEQAAAVLADPAHREVARLTAERSAVLLRNEGDLLPLDLGSIGSIAVLGPLADSRRDTLGPWVFDVDLDETVTVLQGIRSKVGEAATVTYAPGVRPGQRVFASMFDMWGGNAPEDPQGFDDDLELQRAVDLARTSRVAVVVVGEWQNMIGEGASRSSLELPGRQHELVRRVGETGTPVVLLVMNGRPLDLRWASMHVPAILDIWYPGSQGGAAVANLLFGDVSPGGRLPFSWPRTVGQVPIVYSHTRSHDPERQERRYWDEESTPLYPFGHGLAYSSFAYADLATDRDTIAADQTVTVSVTVTNTGRRTADEVVQLYVHQRHGTASRPVRELKGFRRITLQAGQSRSVAFDLGADELRYWNAAAHDWVLDPSTFDVGVGTDSTAALTASFTLVPEADAAPAAIAPPLAEVARAFTAVLGPEALIEFSLTDLDTVGVPVWSTWWSDPVNRSEGTGGIGYGPTPERARVGALGECIEHVCAATALVGAPSEVGSFAEMLQRHGAGGAVDPRLLGMPAGVAFDDNTPLRWLPMLRLSNGEQVLVPAEFVASAGSELPHEAPPGGWLTTPVSNGLGAGSSLAQAISHAVLEIVQRDGNGLQFRAMDSGRILDLSGVRDPETIATLALLEAAGVEVLAKIASTDFGMANIDVVGAAPGDDILSATACGEAVHPDREVALRKAVLEFANARARKQLMHGPLPAVMRVAPARYQDVVDAMDPAAEEPRVLEAMLEWLAMPSSTWRPLVESTVLRRVETVTFTDLPTRTPSSNEDLLADVVSRLGREGFEVLYRDLSPDAPGVHAVKVVVPGMEVETVAYHRIGERNAARLVAEGRDDLVRVGEQPDGWLRIHLTPAGRDRLAGDAWLDGDALRAVATGLLPLYREPSRHTAQKARRTRGDVAAAAAEEA